MARKAFTKNAAQSNGLNGRMMGDDCAWRGRRNHNGTTQAWFERVLGACESWPTDSMKPEAIVSLVETLPSLSRTQPGVFSASVDLLRAQNADKAWQKALDFRLAMLKKSTEHHRGDRSGDHLILTARRNAWKAKNGVDGWRMHDGRTAAQFMARGHQERREAWAAAFDLQNLVEIELPCVHLGGIAWRQYLREAKDLLDSSHPTVKQAIASGRTWKLAVRRVKFLGVRGAYDPISSTVVVDPRHPETLLHELAHWVLAHDACMPIAQAELEVKGLLLEINGRS